MPWNFIESHKSVAEVSKELEVHKNLLYQWRSKFQEKGKHSFSGNSIKTLTPEEAEIEKLKKQLREVEMERDILTKAVGIPVCRQAGSPRAMAKVPIYEGS